MAAWTAVTVLVMGVAGLGFHFPHALPAEITSPLTGPFDGPLRSGSSGLVFGAAAGGLIGLFQWGLLRQLVPDSAWWIAGWAAGAALGHAIGDVAGASIGVLPVALASGVALASALWTAVGRRSAPFELWEPVVAGAYVVGLLIGLRAAALAGLPAASSRLLIGAVMGLVIGPATGFLLLRQNTTGRW